MYWTEEEIVYRYHNYVVLKIALQCMFKVGKWIKHKKDSIELEWPNPQVCTNLCALGVYFIEGVSYLPYPEACKPPEETAGQKFTWFIIENIEDHLGGWGGRYGGLNSGPPAC
jgi:hypothetical protein